MFDLKFPPVLKNGHIFLCRRKPISIWQHWIQLATAVHRCHNLWPVRRIWVSGIHKLANTVSLLPRQYKPRTLLSLCCIIAVYGASELELKVICVIGNSTIFLLVHKNLVYPALSNPDLRFIRIENVLTFFFFLIWLHWSKVVVFYLVHPVVRVFWYTLLRKGRLRKG